VDEQLKSTKFIGNIMRHLALFLFVISASYASSLRTGDVLLQPLSCRVCYLIEKEEGGPYSHMGIVFVRSEGVFVAEALGSVKLTPLKEFLSRPTAKRSHLIIRNREISKYYRHQKRRRLFPRELWKRFETKFLGLSYDEDFLWFNRDEHRKEKLYCSEMITKLLNRYLSKKIPTKKMHFRYNRKEWKRYFRGSIPDGLPGNSPMDFLRMDEFEQVGVVDWKLGFHWKKRN
jgi:hypothetical protein